VAARLSVLIYAQALSGVGHYVRSFEIARALSRGHDVRLVDGGRYVPRPAEHEVQRLELPRMVRGAAGLAPLLPDQRLDQLMAQRARALQVAVASFRPQVLIIEHYPFSKWDLESELLTFMAAARAACPHLLVVCSLRDIVRQTRFEHCSAEHYVAEVLRLVERDFDAIMIHGEERLTPLGASFAGAAALRVPIGYTGIVAERLTEANAATSPYLLVSSGGGSDPLQLASAVRAALASQSASRLLDEYRLIVCEGLSAASALPSTADVRAFAPDFLRLLSGASLSISYAGYNTCANLLSTGRRALLAVHPAMSDQAPRAALMQSLNDARVVAAKDWAPRPLAQLIQHALAAPLPNIEINLDGAERSAAFIEHLWEARRGFEAS
jgi:predicted glycosyltransferase